MEWIILGLMAAVFVVIVFWLMNQLKYSREQLTQIQQQFSSTFSELSSIQENLRSKENELVKYQTMLNHAESKIQELSTEAIKKEQELKEQLQQVAKNVVFEGTKALQTEQESQLNHLLQPFKEKIETFEKQVREHNLQNVSRMENLQGVIKLLSEQHTKMQSTAQNLVDALRGDQKTQGDWGEMALERILEISGLEKNREYFIQPSFADEHGNQQRPDVIIQLPDEKQLIVDSKVSLKAFERFVNTDSAEEKKQALQAHLISLKTHIKQLGEKNYQHLPDVTSPEFVLMFIPLESSFALAMKEEPNLYQTAWEKKVVLVTPSTLLATLKTVASLWKQENANRNSMEIARQAGALYDKFVAFIEDMEKIGNKQQDAFAAYQLAMNKLQEGKGNLIGRAQRLKELGLKTKKDINGKYLED